MGGGILHKLQEHSQRITLPVLRPKDSGKIKSASEIGETCYQACAQCVCLVHVYLLMLTHIRVAPTWKDSWEKGSPSPVCCLLPLLVTPQRPWWIESGCCMWLFVSEIVLFPPLREWPWTPIPFTIFPTPPPLTASQFLSVPLAFGNFPWHQSCVDSKQVPSWGD